MAHRLYRAADPSVLLGVCGGDRDAGSRDGELHADHPQSGTREVARVAWYMRSLAAFAFFSAASALLAQLPESGTLPEHWPTGGPECMEMQEYYIHQYNPNFYILRQSGCTDYEKPFLYLIFGRDKAMLWDTGSRNSRVREAVDRLMERWLKANSRTQIPLVIVHSHRHGDHIAGDAQFAGRPDTTLVRPDLASVKEFFDFQNWPEEVRTLDLGERVMDIVPIPGHTDDSFALYDR